MPLSSNNSLGSQSGFSIYADGVFEGNLRPEFANVQSAKDGKYVFASMAYARTTGLRNIEIYTPLYNRVYEVFVGLKEGSILMPAKEYSNDLPVVFYGSSITQGGCASHAGNDYVSIVCRKLNLDYINLGFSGNAKGESNMADYLATLKASVIVLDYDFNAPNAEWLEETHYPLYKKIRKAQSNVPIVFMTRPNFLYDTKACQPRREVIYNNYLKAKSAGDENVWFINGESLLGKTDWDMCTVDNCHPNDLGFYRMAKKVYPVLKKILREYR
jgi:lysophospholipase L1-like esterase